MQAYETFMRRQRVSSQTHRQLLELKKPPYNARRWEAWGAVAAVLLLTIGAILYMWRYVNQSSDSTVAAQPSDQSPRETATAAPHGQQTSVPVKNDSVLNGIDALTIDYLDLSDAPPERSESMLSGSGFRPGVAVPDDMRTVFWDTQFTHNTILRQALESASDSIPAALGWWTDYEINGCVAYTDYNSPELIVISGEKEDAGAFTLYIPCTTLSDRWAAVLPQLPKEDLPTSYLSGVPVKGWWYREPDASSTMALCTVTAYLPDSGTDGVYFQNIAYLPEPYSREEAEARIRAALLQNEAVVSLLCAQSDMVGEIARQGQLYFITLADMPLGTPLDQLPAELVSLLSPSGKPMDQEGVGFYQWYDGPNGVQVRTTRVNDAALAQWADSEEEYALEQGREYISTVLVTTADYPSAQGFRVGDQVVKESLYGYTLNEGENVLGGVIQGLRVTVRKGVITQMVSTDGGRMVGKYYH